MKDLETTAIEAIRAMFGTVADILHVDTDADSVDIFFRDHRGNIREYYRRRGQRHIISTI